MTPLEKSFLQSRIGNLITRLEDLRWLINSHIRAGKVANFGCNIGGETLALMWALGADEAVGLDNEEDSILQAESTLRSIREDVIRIRRLLHYYPQIVMDDDKVWWETVPEFFKEELLKEEKVINYLVADITKPTELQSDYYDVVYCDFVLHHICYDESREDPESDTQFAVSEMTRVCKPDGVVAARELIQYSDKPQLSFTRLFENAGLRVISEKEFAVTTIKGDGTVAEYIYEKLGQ